MPMHDHDKTVIFDFNKGSNIKKWNQTNDNVMGGISNSKMLLDENGKGVFTGNISTENNGGFAMTRLSIDIFITENQKKIVLYVEGDGKEYQLRIKPNINHPFWYIYPFQTTIEKQKIDIFLKDFYPSYKGNILSLNNFSSNTIKEIAILIKSKKSEAFKLAINKIIIN